MKKILTYILLFLTISLSGQNIGIIASSGDTEAGTPSTLLTGLSSYWKCDESSGTIVDQKGVNNSSANTSAYGDAGRVGTCLTYNSTDITTLANTTGWAWTRAGTYTVSLWINVDAESSGTYANLVGSYTGPSLFLVKNTGTDFQLRLITSNNTSECTDYLTYTIGTWYHILMVKDGTSIKMYRNNVEIGSTTEANAYATDPLTVANIFFANDEGSEPFTGKIDEVGLWSKAISSDERTELYNGGSGVTYPFN